MNVYWLLQSCAASKLQNKCMNISMHASATVFFIELLSGSSGGFRFRFVVGIQICFKDCDL